MYVIIVYDVGIRRHAKIHKFLKQHLTWVQNSVFEGEIKESQFVIIKNEIKKLIHKGEDSIIIYNLRNNKWTERSIVGVERNEIENIL